MENLDLYQCEKRLSDTMKLTKIIPLLLLFILPNSVFAETQSSAVSSAELEVEQFMSEALRQMDVINFGAACPGPGIIAARFITGEINLETAKRDIVPAILNDKATMMKTLLEGEKISDSYEIRLTKPPVVKQEELDKLINFALDYLGKN